MTDAGRLGAERLTIGGVEIAPGDRVVCRENNLQIGARNGTRGRVLAVDSARGSLSLETDAGRVVEVPPDYLARGRVELGYAITGHASQGIAVDRAFVLAPDSGSTREWGYVALSRARIETRIYLAERGLDLDTFGPRATSLDALSRVARSLQTAAATPLARDLAHHAGIDRER